jgi:hypothetical protein
LYKTDKLILTSLFFAQVPSGRILDAFSSELDAHLDKLAKISSVCPFLSLAAPIESLPGSEMSF